MTVKGISHLHSWTASYVTNCRTEQLLASGLLQIENDPPRTVSLQLQPVKLLQLSLVLHARFAN